jgi:hypothetical protein
MTTVAPFRERENPLAVSVFAIAQKEFCQGGDYPFTLYSSSGCQ